ncbi:MAG: HEPN domain-containing protein [Marinosulfonomonas sp.]
MNPEKNFEEAIAKAEHFLEIYSYLTNTRKRAPKAPWLSKCKKLMGWKNSTPVLRIDGKNSILLISDPKPGLTYERFEHDFASETLRASLVASVSALDKYLHDHAVEKCYKLLTGPEKNIPNKLRGLELPAHGAFLAMKKIRADSKSRPGSQLKSALQQKLHQSTFQSSADVDLCIALMGIKKFWPRVCEKSDFEIGSVELKKQLNKIVMRRNYIVHEADIERKISSKAVNFRKITLKETKEAISFVRSFVKATSQVIDEG